MEMISKNNSIFLCVRGSITHNVTVHVLLLWLVFTLVLIRCRHTADRHTQTTHTAQSHQISTPTEVVSLMIYDNMYVYVYMYMYMYMYTYVSVYPSVYNVYMCVCVYICAFVCCVFFFFFV